MNHTNALWTKDFILITLTGLFSALVFYTGLTTMAVYSGVTFGVNESLAGLAVSIFVIGCLFGRILCGRFIGKIGGKRFVLIGCLCFFILSLAYFLPLNFPLFLLLRFLHGMMFGSVHTALATIVVVLIPPNRRGEGIGFFSLNFVIATAIGPFIGLYVVMQFSYTILFAVCSASAFAGLMFALFTKIEGVAPPARQRFAASDIFERKALPLALVIVILSLCYTGVTAFLESYMSEFGTPSAAQLFFVVYAVFILIGRPIAGKMLDRRGDNFVMIPAILSFSISLFILCGASTFPQFTAAALFMALGYGNLLNIGQAIAVSAVQPERVGVATSTYFIFSDIGMGTGPFVMGWVASTTDFSFMYFIESIMVIATLCLYWFLHGRNRTRKALSMGKKPPAIKIETPTKTRKP
jgi:MFS family permease